MTGMQGMHRQVGQEASKQGREGYDDFGRPLADLAQIPWIINGFPLVDLKWSSPRQVIWLPL